MKKTGVKLDQAEIIRLGTPKPSFSYKDRIIISLSQKDGISQMQLSRNLGNTHTNGNFQSVIKLIQQQELIEHKVCDCGQGKILYITSKGRKYAKSLIR